MSFGYINHRGYLYKLVSRIVYLRGGKEYKMHYFVPYERPLRKLEQEDDLPNGYEVYEDKYGYPRVLKGMKNENNHN